jgi:glyoxylase-like metal-dependent hydrolase (beta-lactamase superfamily II)
MAAMAGERKRPEAPRAEKVLPGIWRLRLALPWPGVPHGNVWAVAADGGIVLFDTGIGGKGRLRQFDLALGQAGFGLEDV